MAGSNLLVNLGSMIATGLATLTAYLSYQVSRETHDRPRDAETVALRRELLVIAHETVAEAQRAEAVCNDRASQTRGIAAISGNSENPAGDEVAKRARRAAEIADPAQDFITLSASSAGRQLGVDDLADRMPSAIGYVFVPAFLRATPSTGLVARTGGLRCARLVAV